MTRPAAAILIASAALILAPGCHFNFKAKSHAPKPSSKIATEVEKEFRQRWVDKRTADLVAAGAAAGAAKAQAEAEFDQKFPVVSR